MNEACVVAELGGQVDHQLIRAGPGVAAVEVHVQARHQAMGGQVVAEHGGRESPHVLANALAGKQIGQQRAEPLPLERVGHHDRDLRGGGVIC